MEIARMSDADLAPSSQTGELSEEILNLRRQNAELSKRLSNLIDAIRRISGSLNPDTVLEEVIESACALTGAKYGAILAYDESGEINGIFTSGITPEEHESIEKLPTGEGLLGFMNEIDGPLRLADLSTHPRSTGFPKNHPAMKTFLGMPIRQNGERLGNIYLTEKENGQEFTERDEETIALLAAQSATAIRNARIYENEHRARADMETLLEISPVGVVVFEVQNARMIRSNREFRRIAGDLIDVPWEEAFTQWTFYRSDGRQIPLSELPLNRVFQFGETVRLDDITTKLPDGRMLPVLINAAPVYSEEGEMTAAVAVVQDMTEVADLEKLRTEFLGLVSEELRMPLATIKGSVSALSRIALSQGQSESRQLHRIIDQQTDLMLGQVNSLVELTYIQAGTLSLTPEPSNVTDLLSEAAGEFMRGHSGAGIQMELSAGLPQVMADKQRIGQVLNNMLYSIARHTTDGSSITVTAFPIDIYVAISVSAKAGVPPGGETSDLLQRMLGPQMRDIGRVVGGESLALAMCKGIVEAHGGRMRMENDHLAGSTTISFTIPAVEQPVSEEPEMTADPSDLQPPEPSGASETEHPKILVVVQDSRMLATVRRILTRADFTPIPVYDLETIDREIEQTKPQIILLDLSPPGTAGLQLTKRLSNEYELPIVVLSARGDHENIDQAFEMGADDYIVKPFSPTELVARIRASLRKRSATRELGTRKPYRSGNLRIDYEARIVTVSEVPVRLTSTEYDLLVELSTKSGRILTHDELLQNVWGWEYTRDPQIVRSYIKSLRRKLKDNAKSPSFIFTEHGIGYRMERPEVV